jgi:hypothetical protein
MRPDFGSNYEPVGLWQPDSRHIIIKRSELRSVATFAGALLHEMHASTGLLDVTRDFEQALTTTLETCRRARSIPRKSDPQESTADLPALNELCRRCEHTEMFPSECTNWGELPFRDALASR